MNEATMTPEERVTAEMLKADMLEAELAAHEDAAAPDVTELFKSRFIWDGRPLTTAISMSSIFQTLLDNGVILHHENLNFPASVLMICDIPEGMGDDEIERMFTRWEGDHDAFRTDRRRWLRENKISGRHMERAEGVAKVAGEIINYWFTDANKEQEDADPKEAGRT